jgi:hypothetical protein
MHAQTFIRGAASAILAVAGLALCGCTFTSDGLELRFSDDALQSEISIEWHGADGGAGIMSATTGDGRAFQGAYLEITAGVRHDQLAPLWRGWDASRGWRSWSPDTEPAFVKTYDGMVLANLSADTGERMRCRFKLESRSRGMAGGGEGKCQLPGGKTVRAAFSSTIARPQRELRGAQDQFVVAAFPGPSGACVRTSASKK